MTVVKIDKATKDKLEAAGITVHNELALAIKNGDFAELGNIAYVYRVEKEYTKALALYQIAADKNDAKTMYEMGHLYHEGFGVAQNYLTAIEWSLKAYNLGYEEGIWAIRKSLVFLRSTPEQRKLYDNIEKNIVHPNKNLTPAQQERVKKAVLKEIEDYIKTEKERVSKKRKMAEEEEDDEENSKKIKAVEDKFKLLEDKVKLWEDKANTIQQSNQNLMTLLEQERQIRNNEITLMKQKIEMLEKQ